METYGKIMVDILREHKLSVVWYGSLDVIHECWKRKNPKKKQPHPLQVIQAVLNGVGRSKSFSRKNVLMEGHWCRFFFINKQETGE